MSVPSTPQVSRSSVSTALAVWPKVIIASVPIFVAVATSSVIVYGDLRETRAKLESIDAKVILHQKQDAHGTVRAELARLSESLANIGPRIKSLEQAATRGERYTEFDASEDRKIVLELVSDLRLRINRIENLIVSHAKNTVKD